MVIEEAASISGARHNVSRGGRQKGPRPSTLPDLRRRPGWSLYTGLQDPVLTGAVRSSSDPTTTAAWCVRIKIIIIIIIKIIIIIMTVTVFQTRRVLTEFLHFAS